MIMKRWMIERGSFGVLLLLKELKDCCLKCQIFDRSAQLAYYFLLSLFPFLLLTVSLLAYSPFNSQDIFVLLKPFIPADSFQLIQSNLRDLFDVQRGEILSFSLLSIIYPASLAFQSIIRTLNLPYEQCRRRSLWKNILLATFFMVGILFALVFSLLLVVFGKLIGGWLIQSFHLTDGYAEFWEIVRWGMSTFLLFFVFLCIYKFIPNARITFFDALPGALCATLGWQMVSLIFASYVNLDHYSLIYGNLGAVIILLVWLYLTAFILIFGGQVNVVWKKRNANKPC